MQFEASQRMIHPVTPCCANHALNHTFEVDAIIASLRGDLQQKSRIEIAAVCIVSFILSVVVIREISKHAVEVACLSYISVSIGIQWQSVTTMSILPGHAGYFHSIGVIHG